MHISLYGFKVQLFIIKLAIDMRIIHFLSLWLVMNILGVWMRGHHVIVVNHQILLRFFIMLKHLLDLTDLNIVWCAVIRIINTNTRIRLSSCGPTFEGDLLPVLVLETHLLSRRWALHSATNFRWFLDVRNRLGCFWQRTDRVLLFIQWVLVVWTDGTAAMLRSQTPCSILVYIGKVIDGGQFLLRKL
jgi:hypothetical protein